MSIYICICDPASYAVYSLRLTLPHGKDWCKRHMRPTELSVTYITFTHVLSGPGEPLGMVIVIFIHRCFETSQCSSLCTVYYRDRI